MLVDADVPGAVVGASRLRGTSGKRSGVGPGSLGDGGSNCLTIPAGGGLNGVTKQPVVPTTISPSPGIHALCIHHPYLRFAGPK